MTPGCCGDNSSCFGLHAPTSMEPAMTPPVTAVVRMLCISLCIGLIILRRRVVGLVVEVGAETEVRAWRRRREAVLNVARAVVRFRIHAGEVRPQVEIARRE